jgi:hypothetical protein
MGPPDNELPGAISFSGVLGRTDEFALAVVGAAAYSTGISLSIVVRLRHSDSSDDRLAHEMFGHHRRGASGQLLLGVSYPDGRTVTNVASRTHADPFRELDQPEQPTLVQRGGGGGDREFGIDFWLAPLPPPGDLTIVVEWPSRGIPETHTTVPAELLKAGLARTVELWPWEPPTHSELAMVEPPALPEGGWFAQHAPDASERDDAP